MNRLVDLSGKKFGRLTVVSKAESNAKGQARWNVVCECGTTFTARGDSLKDGNTSSCGCLMKEKASFTNKTHGDSKNPTYSTWQSMKSRCTNKNNVGWHKYGGKGIKVCDRWLTSYENFLEDMGERPKGTTLDRIDPKGNYEPSNCRWATPKEQANNTTKNRTYIINNQKMTLAQISEFYGIKRSVLYKRIRLGWNIMDAVFIRVKSWVRKVNAPSENAASC